MEQEKWKIINGFKNVIDDTYEVSNFGNVRYKDSKFILHKKIANNKYHPYYAVSLLRARGNAEWVLVHQLVATYFVDIPEELLNENDIVPDHLDNNGLNNYYLNLEWKTRGMNVSDAFKMGYIDNSGEKHRDVFISEKEANLICKYLESDASYDVILNIMNFPNNKKYRTLLVRIKNGLAWKNVSKKYNIKHDIKYTSKQLDTIEKIPKICELISNGKSNAEIFDIVYEDVECNRDTKINIIRRIRNKTIYKEILSKMK